MGSILFEVELSGGVVILGFPFEPGEDSWPYPQGFVASGSNVPVRDPEEAARKIRGGCMAAGILKHFVRTLWRSSGSAGRSYILEKGRLGVDVQFPRAVSDDLFDVREPPFPQLAHGREGDQFGDYLRENLFGDPPLIQSEVYWWKSREATAQVSAQHPVTGTQTMSLWFAARFSDGPTTRIREWRVSSTRRGLDEDPAASSPSLRQAVHDAIRIEMCCMPASMIDHWWEVNTAPCSLDGPWTEVIQVCSVLGEPPPSVWSDEKLEETEMWDE